MLFGYEVQRMTSGLAVAEIAEDHQEDVHKHQHDLESGGENMKDEMTFVL